MTRKYVKIKRSILELVFKICLIDMLIKLLIIQLIIIIILVLVSNYIEITCISYNKVYYKFYLKKLYVYIIYIIYIRKITL